MESGTLKSNKRMEPLCTWESGTLKSCKRMEHEAGKRGLQLAPTLSKVSTAPAYIKYIFRNDFLNPIFENVSKQNLAFSNSFNSFSISPMINITNLPHSIFSFNLPRLN